MKQIKNLEKTNKIETAWKPTDVAFIKMLLLENGNLRMTLLSQTKQKNTTWPNLKEAFFEITCVFLGVVQLKLSFQGSEIQSISGFDIVDISNDGWANASFKIEDYEEGVISFYCNDVSIESVSDALWL